MITTETTNNSIYYANKDTQATANKQVETLIKEIDSIGQRQSILIKRIRGLDLNKDKNYIQFVDLMNVNADKLQYEFSLLDFYKKVHSKSLCSYEFMILSSLNENNALRLIKDSLESSKNIKTIGKCDIKVKINSKSSDSLRLPLITHNGFYQIINKDVKNTILTELTSLRAVKHFLIKNRLKYLDISIIHQNNSSSLRNCHFEWGNTERSVC